MKMWPPPLWRHIAFNYQQGGARQVMGKVVMRARRWLGSQESWLVYRADTGGKAPSRIALEHRALGFSELYNFRYFKAVDFPEAIKQRLATSTCHGFFLGGRLANVAWTTIGRLEIDAGVVIEEPGIYGIFDCWTFDEFRGRGIYPTTLELLLNEAKAAGFRTALIAVDPGNVASRKGIDRAGFVLDREVTRSRRFGRATVIAKTLLSESSL